MRSCPRLAGTFSTRFRGQRPRGAALAFGSPVIPRYQFDQAEIILSLDCDFLGLEEDGARHHRGFSRGRLGEGKTPAMNRLYVVESRFSLTGGMADHRLRLPASHVRDYTMVLARELLRANRLSPRREALRQRSPGTRDVQAVRELDARWVREVAADLRAHPGKGIIIAGRRQPPIVHALAFALDATLGNLGKTIELRKPPARPAAGTLEELVQAIGKGQVETLVILGGNPAYNAPADLDFAARMKKVATTIRLGLHADETSRLATWHLPAAHYLESWGDARAGDGTVVPIQPLIEPLFGGRNVLEEVARLSRFETSSPYEIVRRTFRKVSGAADGWIRGRLAEVPARGDLGSRRLPGRAPGPGVGRGGAGRDCDQARPGTALGSNLELVLDRDAKVDDGRFANNGWLQELPNPITKLTWDNAAILSPKTARELGVAGGDVVRAGAGRPHPGDRGPDPSRTGRLLGRLALGYGRTACGRVGQDVGFNAYLLRTSGAPDIALGLKVSKTGRRTSLACTQDHFTMDGRDLIRESPLSEFVSIPWRATITRRSCAIFRQPRFARRAPVGDGDRPQHLHRMQRLRGRLPEREQHPDRGQGGGAPGPRDALDPDRPLFLRRTRTTRSWSISRSPASSARTPRARWSARSTRRCTATKGSTSWSTTGASAPATARTTARTRCGGSTSSTTTSGRSTSCGSAP